MSLLSAAPKILTTQERYKLRSFCSEGRAIADHIVNHPVIDNPVPFAEKLREFCDLAERAVGDPFVESLHGG
jgi:hypothetical protein